MENKFGKYLKYAIGEIILVVIGILIALQINNWNEIRKQNVRADEYHQRIYQDFERLTKQSNRLMNQADKILRSITITVELLESGNELTDEDRKIVDYTLIWFSRTTYQIPTLSTYEEMKGNGDLKLIYDVEKRNKITDFYNYLAQVEKVYDKFSKAMEDDFIVFGRYLRNYVDPETLRVTYSYDFSQMSSDQEFINTFSRLATHWRGYVYFLKMVHQDGQKLMEEFAKPTN